MKKVTLLLVGLLCLAGCVNKLKGNDPKNLTISPQSSLISAASQSLEYKVVCDKSWTAAMMYGTWAKVTECDQTAGRITVSASINESAEQRTDTLTVKSGTLTRKVPIVQRGITSVLSSTDIVLAGTETSFLTIHADAPWSASAADAASGEWLLMEPSRGDRGNCLIRLAANGENVNVGDRNTLVRFDMGSDVFYATVTQKQTDAIIMDRDKVELSNGAQPFDVTVNTNVDYEVEITCDWIEKAATKGLNSFTETFTATANTAVEPREGIILFKNGKITEAVHVFQAECDILLFSGSETDVPAEGGYFSVELRSNVEYETIWPDADWITPARGSGGTLAVRSDELCWNVSANRESEPRKAEITVKDRNSDLFATITVKQEGNPLAFCNKTAYGIYLPDGEEIFTYKPGRDQTALKRGKNGETVSFRIQDPDSGHWMMFTFTPVTPGTVNTHGLTVSHNLGLAPRDGTDFTVTPVKSENGRTWFYDSAEGLGFITKY